jgi:hypothetical protein
MSSTCPEGTPEQDFRSLGQTIHRLLEEDVVVILFALVQARDPHRQRGDAGQQQGVTAPTQIWFARVSIGCVPVSYASSSAVSSTGAAIPDGAIRSCAALAARPRGPLKYS